MVSKSEFHLVRSLQDKKNRKLLRLFVAETPKVVSDLIVAGLKPHTLFVLESEFYIWQSKADAVKPIKQKELERLSALGSANEIVAVFNLPEDSPFVQAPLLIALDGINDPGNLGTIIRTADWFGFHHFAITPDTADPYNPKCVQASMGSIGRAKFFQANAQVVISQSDKNTQVFGAFLDGKPLSQIEPTPPCILVIGSEAHGIRPDWEKHIQSHIVIPAGSLNSGSFGRAESLNAASASSILLYHFSQKL